MNTNACFWVVGAKKRCRSWVSTPTQDQQGSMPILILSSRVSQNEKIEHIHHVSLLFPPGWDLRLFSLCHLRRA
jgi:hypothetical protein